MIVAGPGSILTAAEAPGDEKPLVPAAKEGGFTRESMSELSRPDPTPAPPGTVVSPQVVQPQVVVKNTAPHRVRSPRIARSRVDSKDVTLNPRFVQRHATSSEHKQAAIAAHSHRRNPVVSFVFWWNGFVIKTFHTNTGTVLLNKVGAKI